MKIAHLIIHGYVQGVGYRKFVRHMAGKLGLVGWVRNCPDGSVEVEIAGEEKRIEKLISLCRKGPMLSEVNQVAVGWVEVEFPFTDFVIKHE